LRQGVIVGQVSKYYHIAFESDRRAEWEWALAGHDLADGLHTYLSPTQQRPASDLQTLLCIACEADSRAVVRLLLTKYKASPNDPSTHFRQPGMQYPLWIAEVRGFPAIMQLLLDSGRVVFADCPAERCHLVEAAPGITTLHRITLVSRLVVTGQSKLLRIVLQAGAPIDERCPSLSGKGPNGLWFAMVCHTVLCMAVLLEFGASCELNYDVGVPLLQLAAHMRQKNCGPNCHAEVRRTRHDDEPTRSTPRVGSALHLAMSLSCTQSLAVLLRHLGVGKGEDPADSSQPCFEGALQRPAWLTHITLDGARTLSKSY
jgi:hypothetical protein